MNKTKKDKYLRKNRHSKHSNKNKKTRKMQRGGQPHESTLGNTHIQPITPIPNVKSQGDTLGPEPKSTVVPGTGGPLIIPPSVSSSSSSPAATQPLSVGVSVGGPTGGQMIISPPVTVPVDNAHGVPITNQQHPQQQQQQQQQQHPQQQQQQQQDNNNSPTQKLKAEDTPRLTKVDNKWIFDVT